MAKGSPSLIALLGLLAVAGYQNRDKLGELLNSRSPADRDPNGDPDRDPDRYVGRDDETRSSQGGILDGLRDLAGGAGAGGALGGLSELFGRFTAPHQQAKVDTWVQRGPNAPLSAAELEEALDEDTISELVATTGLSRAELLLRLSASVPDAVDQVTPDGYFPPVSVREPRSI